MKKNFKKLKVIYESDTIESGRKIKGDKKDAGYVHIVGTCFSFSFE